MFTRVLLIKSGLYAIVLVLYTLPEEYLCNYLGVMDLYLGLPVECQYFRLCWRILGLKLTHPVSLPPLENSTNHLKGKTKAKKKTCHRGQELEEYRNSFAGFPCFCCCYYYYENTETKK